MCRIYLSFIKQLTYCMLIIIGFTKPCFPSSNIHVMAEEFGPKIGRMDFELAYTSTVKGRGNYKTNILYIAKYQVVYIRIKNNSNIVLNVNPNNFTLVSNMKISYPYSSETHTFKDKVRFIDESPLQAVNVYPGTTTEGFLLFEKKHEDERPQKLYFQSIKEHLSIDVILDKKVRKQ